MSKKNFLIQFKPPDLIVIYSVQLVIILIGNRPQPFVRNVFGGNLNRQMRKPTVRCRSAPMLDSCGNIYHISGMKPPCLFAPFLIAAFARKANMNLSAAFIRIMNMPVVAAAWLKRYVKNTDLFCGNRRKIALSDKIILQIRHWAHRWETAFLRRARLSYPHRQLCYSIRLWQDEILPML